MTMASERPTPQEGAFTEPVVTQPLESATDEPTAEEAEQIRATAEEGIKQLQEIQQLAMKGELNAEGGMDVELIARLLPVIENYLKNVQVIGPDAAQAMRPDAARAAQQAIGKLERKSLKEDGHYKKILEFLRAYFPDANEMAETQEGLRVQEVPEEEDVPTVSPEVVADLEMSEEQAGRREEALQEALAAARGVDQEGGA